MKTFKIKFFPDNLECEVEQGATILAAAIKAGIHINSACGGDGVCGRCKVVLLKGNVVAQPTGLLSLEEKNKNYYLACSTSVHSDLEVKIPPESRIELDKLSKEELGLRLKGLYAKSEEQLFSLSAKSEKLFLHSPLATKLYLELPEPTLDDKVSDLDRLYRAVRSLGHTDLIQTGLANIRQLGELLRSSDWKVTVTLGRRGLATEIVLIEPGDTSDKNFGMAFDIGTTTISGQLINLKTKEIAGTRIEYNMQAAFGPDVITRIIFAKDPDGLEKLHLAVVDGMNEIIGDLVKESKVDLNNVTCVLCAGNTTMIHLLLRVDPSYIRREPYVPVANFIPNIRASEVDLMINPRGLLSCIPGVASYLGGDLTAGVLSCGIDRESDLSLLIDIGTNGEIILGNRDFLIGCAASAGPAFEGSGVSSGMRAAKGAIQKVKIEAKDYSVKYTTILDGKPQGICGSGYIDLLAEMLEKGIIEKSGKIKNINHQRVRQGEYGMEFVVVPALEASTGKDIVITEVDIDNLKRAKAAIYAAVSILVRHMDFELDDIKKVFIAGGFGAYLDLKNAVKIGLLPDVGMDKFIYVGNSSLAGVRSALLSCQAMEKAQEVAKKITYFELSVDNKYMDEYMAALFFPHTDLTRFKSVKL
ncbi:MAG: ASKHA domain-containing protein [Candidatus Omnitrophica bacterium]|nr:ASKHA domain-containing protein [Candidatus Omnitrophota bacterium]MDD5610398.1 ASKHA domain-containing protein [Candidatus Omnitrophota bacterium]